MGHVRVYTICDVLARYYKQKGFNVLNPMGWDSFGLPAENAAIQRGISPKEWTHKNIDEMKQQLQRLGFDFDWDRELATHSPEYYKHTQTIFLELYRRGLVSRKESYVNWDPVDQTVLANEQIDANGCSWRSGAKVEKRLLKQWFFNIREYAEEMLNDLEQLDKWPEKVKELQRGWIGKKEGATVTFNLNINNKAAQGLRIFTTRPETIYGATFLALSPENPIIQQHLIKDNPIDESAYERYMSYLDLLKHSVKKESDYYEQDQGLMLRNVKGIHPLTGEEIPVYLASYVLNDYGSGAIMGVPFHDERDCNFALKNNINMIQVIEGDEENDLENCVLANSSEFSGLKRSDGYQKILDKLTEMKVGQKQVNYKFRDWLVSRQRYWGVPVPIVHCESCGEVEETNLPLTLPELQSGSDVSLLKKGQALKNIQTFIECKCPKCGGKAQRDSDTLDTFVDSSWYFLRFLDPQNKEKLVELEKMKKWMPVDIYVGGMEHAIMHLLYARFIHKSICDVHGIEQDSNKFNYLREPFKELIVQGLVKGKTYKLRSNGKYIFPDELPSYQEQEYETSFEKMSKSKGNGIVPDAIASKYGVDSLRLALMFSAPPESDVNFDEAFVQSIQSFLDKVARQSESISSSKDNQLMEKQYIQEQYKDQMLPIYELLIDIGQKINQQRFFHVAIARLMELNNYLGKLNQKSEFQQPYILGQVYLIQALYPYAPHLCSELWSQLSSSLTQLGFKTDIRIQKWEDMKTLFEKANQKVLIRVQLNGKFLNCIEVPKEKIGNAIAILEALQASKDFQKYNNIVGKKDLSEFKKVIAPQDKPVINFIV